MEAIDAFNTNSDPDKQSGMITLIFGSLRELRETDFWDDGLKKNGILLEILRNLKAARYEVVAKPLENYCSWIHRLEGIRDSQGNLLEAVKQHLMFDAGLTSEMCKRRSNPPKEISFTSWRRSI